MAKPTIGVHSALPVALGPIPVEAMGVTLLHEHILLDASSWWKRPCCGSEIAIAERPLDISMIGDLRMSFRFSIATIAGCSTSGRRSRSSIILSSTAGKLWSIRPISELDAIHQRCSGSAGELVSTS